MTRRSAAPAVSSGEALKLTRKQRREGVTVRGEVEGARAAVSGKAASAAAPLDVSTARSAHRAARRVLRRSAASFDLHTVSDACASLVLDGSAESTRVCATTRKQRCSVRAVAALYGLCCEEERPADATSLVLCRSPYWPAALPHGDAETMLARVLARGGAAFDLAHLQALARSNESPQQRPAKAKRKKSEAGDRHAALIMHVQPPSLPLPLPLPLPRLAWAIDRT